MVGRVLMGLFRVINWVSRMVFFVLGLRWIFSREYRDQIKNENWWFRYSVFGGATASLIASVVVVALIVIAIFRH
jgi:hypothetical protein